MLVQQDLLVSELKEIMTTINTSKEDRPKRVSLLHALSGLISPTKCRLFDSFNTSTHYFSFQIQKLRGILSTRPELLQFRHPIRLPLDPAIKVTGILSEQASLFKSALIPAKLGFKTEDNDIYWVS